MYEQMQFDVTLDSERELKENVELAVSFACKQLASQEPPTVASRHEGYGIAAEAYSELAGTMKKVGDDMKTFLKILPAGNKEAIDASASLYNSAIEVAFEAIRMASQANRVMNDLYKAYDSETTPLEDYLAEQETGGFEEAEAEPEPEAEQTEGEDDGE